LNTGSLARETSVPSKSVLSSRIGEGIRTNLGIDFGEAIHDGLVDATAGRAIRKEVGAKGSF
jgi:hypothetical protein